MRFISFLHNVIGSVYMNTNKQLASCMIFQVVLDTALCEILYRYMNKEKLMDSRNSFFWKSAHVITMSLMKAADVIYTTAH